MAGEAVFISYRREDSKEDAANLYQALAARIGERHLYKDVDNIPIGADFGLHIKGILPQCRIALILVGPGWAKSKDKRGGRRLEDPFDWVRLEVELALTTSGLRVIPVLVNGARMPKASDVPASLHQLLGLNAATLRRGSKFRTDADKLLNAMGLVVAPAMIRIPTGEFIMGGPPDHRGSDPGEHSPKHRVSVPSFELGKYPVTFAEWDVAIAAGAPLPRPDDFGYGRNLRPVINVSWLHAQGYISWLNSQTSGGYRLPSEAEWEYACRAGTTSTYSTGDMINGAQASFGSKTSAPVGSFPPNAFGLYDMHGNVLEWCEDVWHDSYENAPCDGSAWVDGDEFSWRVVRGGAYAQDSWTLHSAKRQGFHANETSGLCGFRIARTI